MDYQRVRRGMVFEGPGVSEGVVGANEAAAEDGDGDGDTGEMDCGAIADGGHRDMCITFCIANTRRPRKGE